MDLAWLEERARQYTSRWEASAAGVAELLERKIRQRCERTGEASDSLVELIPGLIEKLVESGFVDDRRFAAGLLERQRRRGDSTARIRARLHAKGISESLVDRLLAEEEPAIELQSAWKLARRRRLGPHCKNSAERKQSREKHIAVLCRQGFDPDMATRVIDAPTPPERSEGSRRIGDPIVGPIGPGEPVEP